MEHFDYLTVEDDDQLEEGARHRSSVFLLLKPYCLELLALLQNPKKDSSAIHSFLQFLRTSPSDALQPFFDYTLFPLLLLLDTAVGSRTSKKDAEDKADSKNLPHKVSDKVAEGILQCLEELLKKCHLGSVDQMVVLMKKLTHAAMLSPLEASEEFREGVIKCFRSLILGLPPCIDEACSCRQSLGLPSLLESVDTQALACGTPKYRSDRGECLLAFLQSQTAAAAVGHWLSLLLKAADTEAARGHRGNAKIRVEAFFTLRILVSKVGTADALAFFLPGVVSQFAKVLHVSKTLISGAAGSVEATEQAIRGLAEYLMIVLQDDANVSSLDIPLNVMSGFSSNKNEPFHSLLDELRHLPSSTQGPRKTVAEESVGVAVDLDSHGSDIKINRDNKFGKEIGSLHVDRTRDWIEKTSVHLDKLLSATFPHICVHSAKKVRRGLLAAIQGLLSKCSYTLKDSRLMLLVTAARFLDVLFLCLSQNSLFAGDLHKLTSARPSSVGFLPSVAELKANSHFLTDYQTIIDSAPSDIKLRDSQARRTQYQLEIVDDNYKLPRMPPWFAAVGSQKLYQALSGILRLVGLSLMADFKSEGYMSVVIDIPLDYLRKLISEVRIKGYNKESWQSWYSRTGSGQLLRQASTAVCILNEMIFGLSDQSVDSLMKMLRKSIVKRHEIQEFDASVADGQPCTDECSELTQSIWKFSLAKACRSHLIDCIGRILHEFLSSEVWDLPVDSKPSHIQLDGEVEEIPSHFFHDTAMLQQVIIDGIGTFAVCLGKDFSSSGFLHTSLYLLLENLICSNFHVRSASDAVLHVLASTSGHPTVGQLILANADYVIDSVCQQLRHLDLNPHVPSVLASMLSYVGVAHKILPLLEEPMRSASQELEILARHQHPELTIPFLKAVAEIARALKREASSLPTRAESYLMHVKSNITKEVREEASQISPSNFDNHTDMSQMESDGVFCSSFDEDITHGEQWESISLKLNDSKRYRRIIGSIAGSCLTAATPLLTSVKQVTCLIAMDIIEDGIITLAKVEEAYQFGKETKETIEEVIRSKSLYQLHDTLDAAEEGTDENRLLPAMNKIWPFLVACIKNKKPVAVRRCTSVVSKVVQICGGDFFSRRFHTDGSHFWKLLSSSPFQRKPFSKEEIIPLQLPYRSIPNSSEDTAAEVSNLKVQVAVLNMVADLSRNKRSASSLEAVLKKVSGLVVGIACSGVSGLQDASVNALHGLASIDPDLIWLLLADVYYSLKKKDLPSPPASSFPPISQLLPPPSSPKGYLYVQYGGQSYGFDIDFSAVETVFKKLHALVFSTQNV
ncbi:hypothetical protein MANES_03G176500v8 [Manihot esculenta]|uniref:Uncharacterized protein n=1 Tax=Manihot esculenta TaxID=3983 RepID=A0ACB7I2W9_MANES|nr:hypothetical protein MANES_03G176500v8 [Manihot esculenta]